MSISLDTRKLTESEITLCETDLIIEEEIGYKNKKTDFFIRPKQTIGAYRKEGHDVLVPFHWGATHFGNDRRPSRQDCDAMSTVFKGILRPEQLAFQNETLAVMNKHGSCLLAVYPGGGKTITSLSIASRVGLKTFILVNKLVLIKQWLETIQNVFGEKTKVQVLYTKSKIDPTCNFYIMNAINVCKKSFQEYANLRIGLVIVDECHLMMTKMFSQSLTYFCPRYVLGLSATPFRPDGYDVFLDLYFGKEKVVRKLFRPHQVLLLESGFVIKSESDNKGSLIWNSVIESQTDNEERNRMIADMCIRYHHRNILILSKRVKQIDTIHDMLIASGQHATSIREGDGKFDKDARIVIATFQKVGTGFSHDKLDMLILATDAEEYFLQYLGRVFRRPDVNPIVIDIVDKHPVLKKHFKSRKKVYEEAGGKIQKYDPKVLNITPPDEEDVMAKKPVKRLLKTTAKK